ncbi:Calx-beta domain-containing protein [Leifsonia sp. 2MCAF36]|uniref:Calx-beta domain-containing protein n=1 Tax=Leifsonia sp. 2MCAF36 TaxID=3232988 RepID=UPI003F9D5DE0
MRRPHALRLACALTLAGIGVLFGAAPALAIGGSSPTSLSPSTAPATAPAPTPADALTPLVDCVQDAPLGAVSARTVVLGYRSTAPTAVTVAAASGTNDLTAGAPDRGQPSTFEPGEHHGVWLLTLDAAAEPGVAWRLGTTEAGFDAAPACTAATAVTVSAPVQVTAGGTAAVSATVTRMLLGAPDTGTIAFSLDGGAPVSAPVAAGVARADLPVATVGPHTVTATYQPATGSGLLSSVGTSALTATAASAPLGVVADSVVAGSSSVLITVTRPSPAGTATADLMTADGTAIAGSDYATTTSTVTFADGQTSTTLTVPLLPRPAGSPAATFFVLLQRASTAVSTASAIVRLPAVPAVAPAATTAGQVHTGAGGGGASSALPPNDPTAAPNSAVNSAQDLAMLVGGLLLTVGGILGVVGLFRAAGVRAAEA